MDKRAVLSLSRKLLSRYKHTAIRTARNLVPQRKQLVFVFGGRTQYWPGMGSELYAKEPVFRACIQQCDAIIQELSGLSVLPNFEGTANNEPVHQETATILTLAVMQIAMFELWKSRGIHPNAVMGLSLGEGIAGYASGALNLRDALQTCIDGARICSLETNDYIPLYIQSDIKTVNEVSKKAPAFLSPIYEAGEQGVLALCHKQEKDITCSFLDREGLHWNTPHKETTWPYHTRLIQQHRSLLAKAHDTIKAMPLQRDYYSCTVGGLIPKNSIIRNDFWFDVKRKPVLLHSTLLALGESGIDLMMHIGPSSLQKGQLLRSGGRNRRIEMLDTILKDEPELAMIAATHQRLKKVKLQKPSIETGDDLQNFLQQFSLDNPQVQVDPYPYFNFLRRYGSVHFLPVHNSWIVLDYQDVEYVLKQPQLFSSTLHKTFDESLVGADPPSHTLVRIMLQPLFSSQVFASLAEFTTAHAHMLLDDLAKRNQFNVVDEFSLPLAQAVVAEFLGLSKADAQALRECVKGHVYAMEFLDNLQQFFKKYLEEYKDAGQKDAASLLLAAVKEEKISMEGAIKLMRLLWVAGMTTTSMLLSTAIHLLAKDGTLKQQLQKNDQLMNRFIDECLRLEAPELDLKRITTSAVNLCDKHIPAGSLVMLSLAAANRDAKHFEQPDEISFERAAKQHMSFGGGYHYCLGVGMARLEAKHALKVILERLPDISIEENNPPAWFPSPHFRGLEKLEVCTKNNCA